MASTKSKSAVLITLFIIIILAIIGFFTFKQHKANSVTLGKAVSINTKDQPTIGKATAPVHIVVFEDLKCANCKIFNNRLYPKIKKTYIDTGIAQYTFINLAFIPGSLPAANAARCLYVENESFFFPFVEYIYHHQPSETTNWATISTLLQFAKNSVPKANLDQLSACIISGTHNNFINNNLKIADKVMKGQIATPAIYINGHKLNSFTMEAMDNLVRAVQK